MRHRRPQWEHMSGSTSKCRVSKLSPTGANRRSANPSERQLSHFDDQLTYSLCKAPVRRASICRGSICPLRTNDASATISTAEIAVDSSLSCRNSNMLIGPVSMKTGGRSQLLLGVISQSGSEAKMVNTVRRSVVVNVWPGANVSSVMRHQAQEDFTAPVFLAPSQIPPY